MTVEKGNIELSVGFDQYAPLVFMGFCGAAPMTTWLATIGMPFSEGHSSGPPPSGILVGISAALTLFAMLVAPWLVPCLVLRARQPRGARIEWNGEEVIEWDGPWRKTIIPWSEVELAEEHWTVRSKTTVAHCSGVQLFARNGSAVITVWTACPDKAPPIRRRLLNAQAGLLVLAAKGHGIEPTRPADWSRAVDPDRPPHRWETIFGRFGYVFAIFAPLLVPGTGTNHRSPLISIAIAVAAAGLLSLRALPSFREVRAIRARLHGGATLENEDMPYRAAGVRTEAVDAQGRAAADRLKLRAALAEAFVRGLCVAMVIASAVFGFVYLH